MNRLAIIVLALPVSACVLLEMPEPAEGRALFQNNCAICHGTSGKGDGSFASGLTLAPADLTILSVQNDGVFPKVRTLSTIDGYTRMQTPGQAMPEFGLLLRGDTVPIDTGDETFTPTPRPLAALLVYLESIQE